MTAENSADPLTPVTEEAGASPPSPERLRAVGTESPRYTILLLVLVGWMVLAGVVPPGDYTLPATVAIQALSLVLVLRIAGVSRRTAGLVAGVGALAVLVAFLAGGRLFPSLAALPGAFLTLAVPVVIVRRVGTRFRITKETVAAALCVYLCAGIVFAYLFFALQGNTGRLFEDGLVHPFPDFVYYSFITLTTTGYGDLAPALPLARMMAVLEALLGQIYLVTVVGVLVANIGREAREQAG